MLKNWRAGKLEGWRAGGRKCRAGTLEGRKAQRLKGPGSWKAEGWSAEGLECWRAAGLEGWRTERLWKAGRLQGWRARFVGCRAGVLKGWRASTEGRVGYDTLKLPDLNKSFVLPLSCLGLGHPPLSEKRHRSILAIGRLPPESPSVGNRTTKILHVKRPIARSLCKMRVLGGVCVCIYIYYIQPHTLT